jgi:hypothetical protein
MLNLLLLLMVCGCLQEVLAAPKFDGSSLLSSKSKADEFLIEGPMWESFLKGNILFVFWRLSFSPGWKGVNYPKSWAGRLPASHPSESESAEYFFWLWKSEETLGSDDLIVYDHDKTIHTKEWMG